MLNEWCTCTFDAVVHLLIDLNSIHTIPTVQIGNLNFQRSMCK